MTELVVSVRLKADGSGLVGQLRETRGELVALKASVGDTAGSSAGLAQATSAIERAANDAGEAMQGAAREAIGLSAANDTAERSATSLSAIERGVAAILGEMQRAAADAAAAVTELARDQVTSSGAATAAAETARVLTGAMEAEAAAARASAAAIGERASAAAQPVKAQQLGFVTDDYSGTAAGMSALIAAETEMAERAEALRNRIDPLRVATEQYNREIAEARTLHAQFAVSAEDLASEEARLRAQLDAATAAAQRNAQATGLQQAGYRQLGQQVQDITMGLSLGISPLTILSQQAGQTATAVEMMGGRFAGAASIIGGVWGSVGIAAVSLLGNLVAAHFSAGDAADSQANSQNDLAKYIDRTTGRIKEQNQALLENEARLARKAAADARDQAQQLRQQISDRRKPTYVPGLYMGGGAQSIAQDPQIGAALDRFTGGGSAGALSAELAKIGEQNPRLRETTDELIGMSAQLVSVSRDAQSADAKIRLFVGNAKPGDAARAFGDFSAQMSGAAVGATELEEAQSRLRTSTTALEKARANLALVELQGRPAVKEGTLAVAEYGRQHDAAAQAVHSAEAAEASARQGLSLHRKELREAAKDSREFERAQRELQTTLEGLERRFDPKAAAARAYQQTIGDIDKLFAAGLISADVKVKFDVGAIQEQLKLPVELVPKLSDNTQHELDAAYADMVSAGEHAGDALSDGAADAADRFRRDGLDAASAIADLLGGGVGRTIDKVMRAVEATSGDRGIGKLLGGLTQKTPAQVRYDLAGQNSGNIITERDSVPADPIGTGLQDLVGKIEDVFGARGSLRNSLGNAVAGAIQGAAIGAATGKAGTDLLGVRGSNTGASLGGAAGGALGTAFLTPVLGPLAGPIGSAVGGVIGSALGGIFKQAKYGTATITSATGDAVTSGNSSSREQAAGGLAGQVQSGLQAVADQLGGVLGDFKVSIGTYDDKYRVNTTGYDGKLKFKGASAVGLHDFGKDGQADAIAFAISDAIADGGIKGLSAAVQRALQSSPDIDKAIAEATKVGQVEQLVGGVIADMTKQFTDFEKQAAERVRIAGEYGFDVLAIEQRNADDRKSLLDGIFKERVGSLQDLLTSINSGDLFEGSATDKRATLLDQIGSAKKDAEAGKDGAADTLAKLYQQLLGADKSAFGTAGPEYAADRSAAADAAARVIQLERDREAKADAQAKAALGAATDQVKLASENNDQNAEIIAGQRQIVDQLKSLNGRAGTSTGGTLITRSVDLSR